MNLSLHFTLAELTASDLAQRKGIHNVPPADVMTNLFILARGLEFVRKVLGSPLLIHSGYRSPALNIAVGGAEHSAHTQGLAADFICPGFGSAKDVALAIVKNAPAIQFDKVIYEGTWVHIQFATASLRARSEIYTATFSNGKPRYKAGIV